MKSVEILVVDDSAADRTSLRFAFERAGAPVTLHAFQSIGQELQRLYKALESRDLAAGSAAARRVFS